MSTVTRREFLGTTALAAGALGTTLAGCRTAAPVSGGAAAGSPLDSFGVTEAAARKVLARAMASGGDYCDLFFQSSTVNDLTLEDQAVNRASLQSEIGVGIRVVRGVETGYAFTESLDLDSMLRAAEVAAAVAAGPARKAPSALRVGRTASYYPTKTPWPGVDTETKVKMLIDLQRQTAAQDPRIKKINIRHTDEDRTIVVLDSTGMMVTDHQPMVITRVQCVAEDSKGRKESNYGTLAARSGLEYLSPARLGELARRVAERTVILFDAVAGPVGELPVVLSPGSSGILLHEAIGHGMEADFARQGTTIYADMVGQRIAPEHVTIVDDGTNPNLRGSINVDDEGNAGQRTVLVEKGILRTFLHDRISARHFKLEPTGNGRRQSFRHMPIPRMRNTYMLGGPHSREEIISSVKRGIYAEHFTNGQVRIGAGDFTFYIKNGTLIEDGRLTRPIKDVNIIGNGPEVLRRVSMVGPDERLDDGGWTCGKGGQGVPVGLGLPTVKISAITVGGTEEKTQKKQKA